MAVSAETRSLLDLYRTMVRIRAFEEHVARHFRDGDVHGFVHLSIGQEAVAAGACAALRRDDFITTTHRGHGHCIAKGADPERMFAELFGRATGLCAGKGGSMHIADPSLGILGANGIVGAGIPVAVGAGLAAQVLGTNAVAVAFFGEGATHCGAFHEGAILAVTWDLPVVLVCENNRYAEFTASETWGGPSVTDRAAAYGLPAPTVEGRDPVVVRDAVGELVERARRGEGPALLEVGTYRFHGHVEGDAEVYRTREEIDAERARDPLGLTRDRLVDEIGEDELVALERYVEHEMDDAVTSALEAPYPAPDAVLEDVHV